MRDEWDDDGAVATVTEEAKRVLKKIEDAVAAGFVKIKCIVHNRPWTHEVGLAHGELAAVPPEVAAEMKARGQVELV